MKTKKNKRLKEALISSAKSLYASLPIFLGIILLIGLVDTLIPTSAYTFLFEKVEFLNVFIGASLGSILAGNPINSYIIAGEFLNQGISLIAAKAFIDSWVTVGIVQLPAESILLGKKFAITRNIVSFFMAIIVAIITVLIGGLI